MLRRVAGMRSARRPAVRPAPRRLACRRSASAQPIGGSRSPARPLCACFRATKSGSRPKTRCAISDSSEIAPIAAPDARSADVRDGADEDSVQRVALHRPAGIGRTAGQPLERRAERGEVLVVRDLRIGILERELRQALIRGVVRHRQEQGEGNQRLVPEQIDIEQLRAALWIGEEDPRARRPRRDRILEPESVEVVVDARVRASRERRVHGPRDFERREVIRVGSRPQQPQRLRRPILDFDPYRLHVRLVDVGAEHAPAVFCAQHRRGHAHVALGGGHGAGAQRGVADLGGGLPRRTANEGER